LLRGAALLAILQAGACVLPQGNGERSRRFAADAARQVRRCYRTPAIASAGRQIATTLRVRYAPDGSLIGLPVIVDQSGVTALNRPYAARMAEAASLAVIRCAPIRVPRTFVRDPWNEFDLSFSPQAML
jgi:hypothetical protein